jgi:hypothetical protein
MPVSDNRTDNEKSKFENTSDNEVAVRVLVKDTPTDIPQLEIVNLLREIKDILKTQNLHLNEITKIEC